MVPVKFHLRQMPSVANRHNYSTGLGVDKKSLINLCLDLSEMNTGDENEMALFEEKIKAISHKINSYVFVDQFSDSQIEMLKKQKEHLDRQIRAFERVQTRLRDMAMAGLQALNVKKIKSDDGHTISMRTSQSVKITNINKLPAWAVDLRVEKTANKTKIKEAIKEGEAIEGAELIESEYVVFK
jgi:cell fate (sporulation/competence/biofilm development) regulator YmcA (YheA/YmcA/DUF963 family)